MAPTSSTKGCTTAGVTSSLRMLDPHWQQQARTRADCARMKLRGHPNEAQFLTRRSLFRPSEKALDPAHRFRGCRSRVANKLPITVSPISRGTARHLRRRPLARPVHSPSANEVVGSAGKSPVADGRCKARGVAIPQEVPTGGTDRRHHLQSAAASTAMHRSAIGGRDVKHTLFSIWGYEFDEHGSKDLDGH